MAFSIGGKRGIVSDPNVVPLIDILLVLLVIFMVIPHHKGLDAQIPQPSTQTDPAPPPDVVVVQVLADGTLRINQQPVAWENLASRLGEVFKSRASRTAFIRGDAPVEFGVVVRVIDVMHTSGVATVGLLAPDLEQGF
jgi:biopolymer transport protein ExbD